MAVKCLGVLVKKVAASQLGDITKVWVLDRVCVCVCVCLCVSVFVCMCVQVYMSGCLCLCMRFLSMCIHKCV
ncbi:hypothetical protein EON63_13050 [archaeon]|nr:MAG: hypothetical protein EON63_13050 [archaeon]